MPPAARRLALALAATAAWTPAALADVTVRLDGATRVALSSPARDVIVANPSIADVQLLSDRSLVVIGKTFGSTTLLVVDRAGRTVLDETVVVGNAEHGQISYLRGGTMWNYNCSPRCERTPQTGEPDAGVFGPYNTPVSGYLDRSKSNGAGPSGGGGAGGGAAPMIQPGQ